MARERLRIWLVKAHEPVPTDGSGVRLLRMAMFAEALAEAGHEVVWWTSTFFHGGKVQRYEHDETVDVRDNYRIRFVWAPGYRKNLSLARVRNHRAVARRLREQLDRESKPDIVVSAFPTPELCAVSAEYGRAEGVPTLIDIRDLWPDFLYTLGPDWARPLIKAGLIPMARGVRRTMARATGVIGISQSFMEWGATMGGRKVGPNDAHFPLGYMPKPPTAEELAAADAYWDERGVGRRDDEFIACYFGIIGECDDMATCIEAARLLRDGDRPFRFVLAGMGPRVPEYQRAAADLPNVLLPGWVEKPHIWSLVRRSKVGLIPVFPGSVDHSLDAIPNKAHEYLYAGLPVLSAYPGDMERFIERHGCGQAIQPGDARGLADILVSLHDDPERYARLASNAKTAFDEHLHGAKVYQGLMEHVEAVATRARRQ